MDVPKRMTLDYRFGASLLFLYLCSNYLLGEVQKLVEQSASEYLVTTPQLLHKFENPISQFKQASRGNDMYFNYMH